MPILLAILFFITAAFYAAVGFGGGSTYNALLVLNGTDYRILPSIALGCNIIVVTGGVIRFWQAGHLRIARLVPFLAASIPAAWLFLSGLHLVFQSAPEATSDPQENKASSIISLTVGGSIGLVSGLVGIGGGIFLAPVLYMLKWGPPRQIAAACSLFILANSLSGLTGQFMKLQDTEVLALVLPYWPLLPAVLVGGQIGSWFAAQGLQANWIKRLTAVLILYVACRLILRWVSLAGLVG